MDIFESIVSNKLLFFGIVIVAYFFLRNKISIIFRSHLFLVSVMVLIAVFLLISFIYGILEIAQDSSVWKDPFLTVGAFNLFFTLIMIAAKTPIAGSFSDKVVRNFMYWILCIVSIFVIEVVTLSAIENENIAPWKEIFNISHLLLAILLGYLVVAGVKVRIHKNPGSENIPGSTGELTQPGPPVSDKKSGDDQSMQSL